MQGGAAHRGAGQGHGLELGHRGHHPRAAHLAGQTQQPAGGLLGGVLEGDRPTRRLLGEAGGVLEAQVVELHHHAVGGVGQGAAARVPGAEEGLHRRQIRQQLGVGIHLEASSLQPLQTLPLAARPLGRVWRQVQGVGKEIQPPGGHHLGIQLAQGAGTGVAGVGERGLIPLGPLSIDGGEGGIGDQGLAAHLQPGGGGIELKPQGHRGDRAHVGGDLLALLPVAAGGSPHQQAVFVAEGEGIAIDFQFPHHRQRRAGFPVEHLEQAAIPGLQFLAAEGVVEAEQGNAVLHAGEGRRRCSPHPLGGAVRGDQLGVGGLELEQFPVEAVVDRILQLGGIQHVVGVGGVVEQSPQFGGAGLVLVGCIHASTLRQNNSGCSQLGDAIDPPLLFHLHEGEIQRQFFFAVALELDGEDQLALIEPGPARFEVAVFVELQPRQEADELLPVDVGAVVLGGEQVGPIHLAAGHLGEELFDQGVDAAGAEHQPDRRDGPVEEQGAGPAEQELGADVTGQTPVHHETICVDWGRV